LGDKGTYFFVTIALQLNGGVQIKMKNSGTFRSDKGADAFLDLLSIVETSKKHSNSPFAAIRALF